MKDYAYTVIQPDGISTTHVLKKRATLTELQEWVGGYIQIIQLSARQWAIVNEEGRIHGLPINTHIGNTRWGPLCGNVVLLPEGYRS